MKTCNCDGCSKGQSCQRYMIDTINSTYKRDNWGFIIMFLVGVIVGITLATHLPN